MFKPLLTGYCQHKHTVFTEECACFSRLLQRILGLVWLLDSSDKRFAQQRHVTRAAVGYWLIFIIALLLSNHRLID